MTTNAYDLGYQYMSGDITSTDVMNAFCTSGSDLKSFEYSLAGGIAACEGAGKAVEARQQPTQDKQESTAIIYSRPFKKPVYRAAKSWQAVCVSNWNAAEKAAAEKENSMKVT